MVKETSIPTASASHTRGSRDMSKQRTENERASYEMLPSGCDILMHTADRSCLYRTKSTRSFYTTGNTIWTHWVTGGSAHKMGWGLGVPWKNGRGEFEMNMVKIHYLHVWNWQRIKKGHSIKKKSMYYISEYSVYDRVKCHVGWLAEILRKTIYPLKCQIWRDGQEAHRDDKSGGDSLALSTVLRCHPTLHSC